MVRNASLSGRQYVVNNPTDPIEELAIRAAKGNNGGEWSVHYTDEQKDYWRQFVRELTLVASAPAIAAERERIISYLENRKLVHVTAAESHAVLGDSHFAAINHANAQMCSSIILSIRDMGDAEPEAPMSDATTDSRGSAS